MEIPHPEFRPTADALDEQEQSVLAAPAPQAVRDTGIAAQEGSLRGAPAPSRAAAASPLVLVAKLVRPHGRRGEMLADILTDFPERFHERSRLFLAPPGQVGTPAREIGIENFWFLRDRMVVKLQGIDSINDAEGLRGYELAIPPAERVPLADGAAYVSDLIGCSVIDLNSDGVNIGEVVDVDRGSSSTDLLVVKLRGGHGEPVQALIPFVRDYLAHMDAASRRIEMRLPEGLLEINAPMTEEEKRESSEQREGEGHRSRER